MSQEMKEAPKEKGPSKVTRAIQALQDSARHRAMADVNERYGDKTGARMDVMAADRLELEGRKALTIPDEVEKKLSVGGEMVLNRGHDPDDHQLVWYLRDTLREPNLVHVKASKERLALALEISDGCLSSALDAADTVGAENSLQKMAAHQMAAAHEAAMRVLAMGLKALSWEPIRGQQASIEGCRMLGAAARLMTAYSNTLSTMSRLRTGGRQEVIVQHVDVTSGGQAVVTGTVAPVAEVPRGEAHEER